MISTRSAVLALGALVLPLALTACPAPGERAPKEGIVKQLQPDSAACVNRGDKTVAVRYQPDGTDRNGTPWPQALACVTPEGATALAEGKRFQE